MKQTTQIKNPKGENKMREFTATNSENTISILSENLGSVFNTLSPEVVESLVESFGDQFDRIFEEGQDSMSIN